MAKNSRSQNLAQVRKSLKILREKGLYKPENARAKPTRYGISLTKKYQDVIRGHAFVLTPNKETLSKISKEFRKTRGHVVVPKAGTNIKPRITKSGQILRRAQFGKTKYRFRPLLGAELPDLAPMQAYSVMIMEGREPIIRNFHTKEELLIAVNRYQKSSKPFDMMKYIQIAEPEGAKKFRVRFTNGKITKRRTVEAFDESIAVEEFRYRYPEFEHWVIVSVLPA